MFDGRLVEKVLKWLAPVPLLPNAQNPVGLGTLFLLLHAPISSS